MAFWRRMAWGAGKGMLALVLVLGLFIAYAAYSERTAVGKAEAFCGAIAAGADAQKLREQALGQGAHVGQTRWSPQADGSDQLWATFTGVFPLSRHICLVTARAGQVEEARLAYLD